MMVEVKKGEGIVFYGSVIAHNVVNSEGAQHSIDCFFHKSVSNWWVRVTKDKHRKSTTFIQKRQLDARDDVDVTARD